MKIWLDGKISDGAEARLSVLDHGLLYGDGVFEGIRAWDGRVFRLDDHLNRLAYGARALHLSLPMTHGELRDVVQQTVDAHAEAESYIRLVVTRGAGPLGVDIARCGPAQVLCIVDTLKIFPKEKQLAGIALATVSMRRPSSDVLDPRIKSLNYLNNVLAKVHAKRAGADSALVLNQAGHIAEADVANLFVVQDGVLMTPPTSDGALDGMTRRTVLEQASALGIVAQVKSLTRTDLFMAEDAFLTGTGAGIVRIATLDGQPIGRGEATATTTALLDRYAELTQSRT